MAKMAGAGVQPSQFKQMKQHETAQLEKAIDDRFVEELKLRVNLAAISGGGKPPF